MSEFVKEELGNDLNIYLKFTRYRNWVYIYDTNCGMFFPAFGRIGPRCAMRRSSTSFRIGRSKSTEIAFLYANSTSAGGSRGIAVGKVCRDLRSGVELGVL